MRAGLRLLEVEEAKLAVMHLRTFRNLSSRGRAATIGHIIRAREARETLMGDLTKVAAKGKRHVQPSWRPPISRPSGGNCRNLSMAWRTF